MRPITPAWILFLVLAAILPASCPAGTADDEVLVTIDNTAYTTADFRVWWENWRSDENMAMPQTPKPFVDWLLLFREAERMKLYQDPAYRKKVLTFLKARTLMLLKEEEIDSRIVIPEQELKARYREEYTPRYRVNILFFPSRAAAERLLARIGPGPVDVQHLQALADGEDPPFSIQGGWYRPGSIDPRWRRILAGLPEGGLSRPAAWRKNVVVLHCQEIRPGDAMDFANMREQVRRVLWKEQEQKLTIALLQKLRQKYHVQVDGKRLQELDISRADGDFSDQPVITTDRGLVTEKEFMAQVRRLQRFRRRNGFREGDSEVFKQQVANGIIDQTLTSWEALSRRYEKRPPFADTYTYYCRHRLIRSLEERVFRDPAPVPAEEVRRYYQEHRQEFTRPEIIRMAIVDGSAEQMNGLWTEVAMGGDFLELARRYLGHAPPVRDVPVDHLQPRVREVAARLARGELSPVFEVEGHVSLLLLVDRKPARLRPLAEVEQQIVRRLRQQREAGARKDFLARLRGRSSIEINRVAWRRLRESGAGDGTTVSREQTSR